MGLAADSDWDEYLVLADYRSYIDCHDQAVGPASADQDRWTQMSILTTARSGFFSSDRTVRVGRSALTARDKRLHMPHQIRSVESPQLKRFL